MLPSGSSSTLMNQKGGGSQLLGTSDGLGGVGLLKRCQVPYRPLSHAPEICSLHAGRPASRRCTHPSDVYVCLPAPSTPEEAGVSGRAP